jgi:two-component system sensor histidine kinase HydH
MKTSFLLLVALPVMDSDNRFSGNTLLIQDISKIRELEKMVQRNERLAALGKMAAGVAHELRNPLSSIKGLAVLLRSKLKKDKQGTDTADILVEEVERLNRSIGELLDFARPPKLQRELIQIEDVLDKAAGLVMVDADSVHVAVESRYKGNTFIVYGDKDKLTQVFLNLFINSIQAMEQGGVLSIDTYMQNDKVISHIEDTGCGIDRESISKVFDPYFTTKSDGTGLGLAMSAKIIEEHNGSIEFRSEVGKGTVVRISLPSQQEGFGGGLPA